MRGAAKTIDLAAGTTRYPGAGARATPSDLFQIGSITKSFTSVALLHLEAAGRGRSTIRNQPSIGKIVGTGPGYDFSAQELVAAAYPHDGKPKPVNGSPTTSWRR